MKTHWPLPLIIQLSCKKRYEGVIQTLKSSDHCLVFCFITPKMRVIIPSKVCWKKEVMSWIYPICLRAWHLVSISSFLMLSKVEFNGSFRTLILIDHVIGGKEVFIECPLYIHHSTRDLSSGVCGCNPCDILHEVVKEHCPSKPPTIAGFFLIVWRMMSAFLPESRPLFSAQTPIRKWVLLPKGIHHTPPSSTEQRNSTLKEEVGS